jgi:LacI family transcriptional regulator
MRKKKAEMIQRNTTMADVARLAGVGKMTISRVLNGSASVSEATTERVRRAIKILHYQPNEVARSLRTVNSKTIGVIVPYLYDPFFATCAHAISTVAKQHGYSVIITTSDENADIEHKQSSLMLRRQVDGMVIIPAPSDGHYYSSEAFSRVHVVTLDRPVPGSRFDSVLVPNRAGAKTAVEHLIGHGHRSIAFLGLSRKLYTMSARYMGYREAMIEAGNLPETYLACSSTEKTVALIRSMLNGRKPPTAIFAANNLTLRYVLQAANAEGVNIPRELAVVGFDDLELADVFQPSITVVRQPAYQLGEVAANLLFERISGGEAPRTGHRVTLPVELIVRRSCGCQPETMKSVKEAQSVTSNGVAEGAAIAASAE